MALAGKWVQMEVIMLSQKNQTQKDKSYSFSHRQNLSLHMCAYNCMCMLVCVFM